MFKEITYKSWGHPFKDMKVVYVVLGNRCYFSGIERGTSTINAAEEIVRAIAKQEGVSANSLRYFDIQTYKGYQKIPGQYEINELKIQMGREMTEQEQTDSIEKRFNCKVIQSGVAGKKTIEECEMIPHVTVWKNALFPADVLEMFKVHIGVDLETLYEEVYHESEGLFCVSDKEGDFFYVQADGKPISIERYFDLTNFHDGLAWVCRKGDYKWAQIDREGNVRSEWTDKHPLD